MTLILYNISGRWNMLRMIKCVFDMKLNIGV